MNSKFDSGLLLTSDFRKTFVTSLQGQNNESEQIRRALVNYKYTSLDDQEKLLLAHDLAFIFVKNFYDFEHGSLLQKETSLFRSDESIMFFSDYLLYFSFISSFSERPKEADSVLKDVSNPELRKTFFRSLREPLSPYLFVTFVHNVIDSINLGSPGHDCSSIEYEMCRQLIINAKELFQLSKFNELHKNLLEKIKSHYKNAHKTVTNEMENVYTFFFAHAFYETISFPSDQFHDPEFKDMIKNIFQILRTNSNEMDPKIKHFSDEADLLSYNTYIFQRCLCISKPNSWVYPSDKADEFQYPAQLRLSILSKKIGDLMGNSIHPIGNSVVKIKFPSYFFLFRQITVVFNYNNHEYSKLVTSRLVEVVFPCFKDIPLEISFTYRNKSKKKNKIVIPLLQKSSSEDIAKTIKLDQEYKISISHKFYTQDKPIEDLTVQLNNNPTNLFNLVSEAFIHKYLAMNANFSVVYRNEDYLTDEDDQNQFKPTNKLRVAQDISGRAFPVDFWLFLCDIAIKYSIPSSYFFARLVEKLEKCWCNSQAYINLYCIMLYNFFYSLQNSEHSKEDDELFSTTMKTIRDKSIHLLMSQLAKPEIYQRPSITSLMLILSLSNEEGEETLIKMFETIFIGSTNNIKHSIYNLLKYKESDKECTSMFLYSNVPEDKKVDFPKGPNNLPLCNIDIESLRNALDLILYRSRSISLFYLESFLPSFANLGNSIMEDFFSILLDISSTFIKMDPIPDQKNLIYFITNYQQLYQLYNKNPSLNPAVIFNGLIEQWMFDLSSSTIKIVENSIKFDTFAKKTNKYRTSDSFIEIFEFFNQSFNFITYLNFKPKEVKDKLLYFLSLNAAICSYYIESLLSIASSQFRDLIDSQLKNVSLKKKSSFPSWCPDRSSNSTPLKFEEIAVITNNIFAIRRKWLKHICIYEKYLPNQPQVVAAINATAKRRELNEGNGDSSSTFLLNNVDESSELIGSYTNFALEGTESIKDPCYKISMKVNFMLNFLRLDLTYEIIGILHSKMWENGFLKFNKQPRERFFSTTDLINADDDNISIVFEKILDIFKEKVQKVKDYLQVALHVKCLPQLVRGLEDGIFECMIPFAFSPKSRNVFQSLTDNIEMLYSDAINFLIECGFGNDITERCVNSIRLLPYVRSYLCQTSKDVNDQLKLEKSKFDGDYTYIILLSIVSQVIAPSPFPKSVNSSYTFISLE